MWGRLRKGLFSQVSVIFKKRERFPQPVHQGLARGDEIPHGIGYPDIIDGSPIRAVEFFRLGD
jgi:hypothetical protein